jgi:hypothetical protein
LLQTPTTLISFSLGHRFCTISSKLLRAILTAQMNHAPRTALARDQHDIATKRPTFEERDLREVVCK